MKKVFNGLVIVDLPYAKPSPSFVETITGQLGERFSPDSSGILTQTMAMRTMAGGGRSNVGMPPDKPVRTPSTSVIQEDSIISYSR